MNKDFDVAYSEYAQSFVDLISSAKMPLSVTISILNDLCSQMQTALQDKLRQYKLSQESVADSDDDIDTDEA